jgi:hypothetical protein
MELEHDGLVAADAPDEDALAPDEARDAVAALVDTLDGARVPDDGPAPHDVTWVVSMAHSSPHTMPSPCWTAR